MKKDEKYLVLTICHSPGRHMLIYPMKYNNIILMLQKGNKTYLARSMYYKESKSFSGQSLQK